MRRPMLSYGMMLACALAAPAVGRGQTERPAADKLAIEQAWKASRLPAEIYGRCELQFEASHVQGDVSESLSGTLTVRDDRVLWAFERQQTSPSGTSITQDQVLLSKSYIALITVPKGPHEAVQSKVIVTRPGAGEQRVTMLTRLTLPRSWEGFRGEPLFPWTDAAGTPLANSPLQLSRIDHLANGNCVFQFLQAMSTIWITVETSKEQANHAVRSELGFADPQEQDSLPGDVAELHWGRNDAGLWYCDRFRLTLVNPDGSVWQPQSPDWPHAYGQFEVKVTRFRSISDLSLDRVQLKALKLPPASTITLETEDPVDEPQLFSADAGGMVPDQLISQVYRLVNTLKSRPPRRPGRGASR